jgi:hypothetical protein
VLVSFSLAESSPFTYLVQNVSKLHVPWLDILTVRQEVRVWWFGLVVACEVNDYRGKP